MTCNLLLPSLGTTLSLTVVGWGVSLSTGSRIPLLRPSFVSRRLLDFLRLALQVCVVAGFSPHHRARLERSALSFGTRSPWVRWYTALPSGRVAHNRVTHHRSTAACIRTPPRPICRFRVCSLLLHAFSSVAVCRTAAYSFRGFGLTAASSSLESSLSLFRFCCAAGCFPCCRPVEAVDADVRFLSALLGSYQYLPFHTYPGIAFHVPENVLSTPGGFVNRATGCTPLPAETSFHKPDATVLLTSGITSVRPIACMGIPSAGCRRPKLSNVHHALCNITHRVVNIRRLVNCFFERSWLRVQLDEFLRRLGEKSVELNE
ncbi:hypothetical protein PC120_g12939 [Phytophthora cactorum]|nr:hypothetical protein PC120_g12939 [Phytophthora cactorum]